MRYRRGVQDESAARRVGTWLREKYRIDALIGAGGMAAVYGGAHRNGNRVAIKLLHPELARNADIRSRFLKEGYVANAVDHPGAVRVLDDDVTEDGAVFIVMELLEGQTLEGRWSRAHSRLPPREVADFAYQVLKVLDAAHAKGIVHRDIKPENLFLTHDGQIKILDFGIARMRDGAQAQAVTRTGRMLGTPAYMPREQALGLSKEVDGRTDLWALGATMFTLISGRYVHEAETPESMIVFTATRPARSLASVAPEVPAPLVSVVDHALAFDKADRFADAMAMQNALAAAYQASFGAPMLGASPLAARPGSVPTLASSQGAVALAHEDTMAASLRVARPVLDVASPPFVAPASPFPSTSPAAFTMPTRVSTTAGVSSGPAPFVGQSSPPLVPMEQPKTSAPANRAGLVVAAAIVMTAGLIAGTIVIVGQKVTKSEQTAPPSSSAQAGIATVPLTPTAAVERAPAPAPSAPTSVQPSASMQAAPEPPAKPLPAVRSREAGAPAMKPAPAAPDCNPPIYFDADGKKRVKPGC
jgi:serine/threonine-protein kinase